MWFKLIVNAKSKKELLSGELKMGLERRKFSFNLEVIIEQQSNGQHQWREGMKRIRDGKKEGPYDPLMWATAFR